MCLMFTRTNKETLIRGFYMDYQIRCRNLILMGEIKIIQTLFYIHKAI